MEQIVVGISDCRIADQPEQVLATFGLGSCIALVVHDPVAGVGGMLHFMLPDSGIDPGRSRENPFMFGDTGIPLLLDALIARGAVPARLVLYAAGGARMIGQENGFEIGRRNYLSLRRVLWKAGLMLRGEAVGGTLARTVLLEVGTGKVWLQEAGASRIEISWCRQKGNH